MANKTNVTINGKDYYRITVDLGRDSKGKRVRKQFLGKNKKEAEKKRDEYLNKVKLGINTSKKYLGEEMNNWLNNVVKYSVKISSFDRYLGIYSNYIKDSTISIKELDSITSIDIQKHFNNLFKNGKSSNSIKNANKLLKQFFTYCVDNDILLKNPCRKIVIPGDNHKKKEVITFTKDEIEKILNANEKTKIRCIALISYATGMRLGEIIGLDSENDIDYENYLIHIRRSVVKSREHLEDGSIRKIIYISDTKTYSSIRDIKLPISLIPIIKEAQRIKESEMKHTLLLGKEYNFKYKNLLFTSELGNLIDAGNIEKSWISFLKRYGIQHKKFHALRHTFATLQYENDVQLYTISNILGHSNIETTTIYTHVTDKSKNKAIDTLNLL